MALVISIPLSAWAARALGDYLMAAFNAEGAFELSPLAIQAQVVIALVAPVLASLAPLWTGSRITVREAISNYGLRAEATLLDRLMAKLRYLPELLALTISNTFRHKQRVILTEITLVLSGLIFMTVMTTRDAANYTFGDLLFSILRFDVNFATERPERVDRLQEIALSQPGVQAVEVWALENATIRLAGQPESNDDKRVARVWRAAADEPLRPPDGGRALAAARRRATSSCSTRKWPTTPALQIGDTVTLKIGVDKESDWRVVGLLFDPIITRVGPRPACGAGTRPAPAQPRHHHLDPSRQNKDSASVRELAQHLRECLHRPACTFAGRLGLWQGHVRRNHRRHHGPVRRHHHAAGHHGRPDRRRGQPGAQRRALAQRAGAPPRDRRAARHRRLFRRHRPASSSAKASSSAG